MAARTGCGSRTTSGKERGHGTTSYDADEVEVRLTRIDAGRRIEQEVLFDGDAPAFHVVMRMAWMLTGEEEGTRATVRAEDVPAGLRPEDHEAAMRASLALLEP